MADLAVDCSEYLKRRGKGGINVPVSNLSTTPSAEQLKLSHVATPSLYTPGDFVHGQPFEVTGSGFGSKTLTDLVYEDFQSVGIGNRVVDDSPHGWTDTTDQPYRVVASNANVRSGTPFSRNAMSRWENYLLWPEPWDASSSNIWQTGRSFLRCYVDYWHYYHADGSTDPGNIKPFRIHITGSGSPSVNPGFGDHSTSDSIATQLDGSGNGEGGGWFSSANNGMGEGDWAYPASSWYDHWVHVQYLVDGGTPGTSTGSAIIYLDGALRFNRVGDYQMIANGYTWAEIAIGNYSRGDGPYHDGARAYWECVTFDTGSGSWARVEIGNNATYANCTHREIQKPTAWSSGSVTFTVNRGSFQPDDTVYLFVVDSTNTVRACTPSSVTIGAD